MEKYSNLEIEYNNDEKKANITYFGSLCGNEDANIFMHYGYGLLWENVSEIEMEKTPCGYMATIDLTDNFDSVHCCFKDDTNCWDNNNAENYNFEIKVAESQAVKMDDIPLTDEEDEILSNSFGKNLSKFFFNIFKSIPNFFKKLTDTNIEIS